MSIIEGLYNGRRVFSDEGEVLRRKDILCIHCGAKMHLKRFPNETDRFSCDCRCWEHGCDSFLVQLSWSDLPYRYETRKLIEAAGPLAPNPYVEAFMDQFRDIDTDRKACFLFPESFVSQFFVVTEVCREAEAFHPVRSLFPDEDKVHYLAVFDKTDMDNVLLMYHLLYRNISQEVYGGYSLYDYPLPWYQTHLWTDGIVLRSPYLPDRLAKYQGNLPFHHNPVKTVYVRRNIEHILGCGYFDTELEFFRNLTRVIMPFFQWWYTDLAMYEEKDGLKTNWRLRRTKIRTDLTAEGVIKPKWKHELTLFYELRKLHPDTLYQYRPDWLGRNKKTMFLNLKKPAAVEAVKKLVMDYDIVVEQFRPGVMDKLGIGYEQLRAVNPRLIYCSITGYGQNGPFAMKAGHDINYLSRAVTCTRLRT